MCSSDLMLRHGTGARQVLGNARSTADLGMDFGHGLHEAEVEHFIRHEWARDPDDVLWRRTRLGMVLGPQAGNELAARFSALRRRGQVS